LIGVGMELEISSEIESINAVRKLFDHLSPDDLESFGFSEREQEALATFYADTTCAVEEFELAN